MKILIAVDSSQCSQTALEKVAQRRWATGTEVLILSVAEPLAPAYGLYVPEDIVDSQSQILESAVQRYKQLAGSKSDVALQSRLEQGYARTRIPQVAREWDADLIVIGSHGRKGFDHVLLGSVAETVVHESPCSVEVVKLKQAKRVRRDTAAQKVVNG